jgi:hypothetical protein
MAWQRTTGLASRARSADREHRRPQALAFRRPRTIAVLVGLVAVSRPLARADDLRDAVRIGGSALTLSGMILLPLGRLLVQPRPATDTPTARNLGLNHPRLAGPARAVRREQATPDREHGGRVDRVLFGGQQILIKPASPVKMSRTPLGVSNRRAYN